MRELNKSWAPVKTIISIWLDISGLIIGIKRRVMYTELRIE